GPGSARRRAHRLRELPLGRGGEDGRAEAQQQRRRAGPARDLEHEPGHRPPGIGPQAGRGRPGELQVAAPGRGRAQPAIGEGRTGASRIEVLPTGRPLNHAHPFAPEAPAE
ncbi:MAG: hypothetical protein ACK559_05275, partial [bacterium]